jgi:hypothetical protein
LHLTSFFPEVIVETLEPETRVEKRSIVSFTWVYPLVCAATLVLLAFGIRQAATGHGWVLFVAGCGTLALVLVTWPLAHALRRQQLAAADERTMLTTVTDRLQQLAVLLELISEQQLLSDRAKAVAFRDKDRDALRRAIQEEILRQDWEAALVLAGEIETQFGYRQEAERFREQINEQRRQAVHRQITDAVLVVDRHIRAEQWGQALKEADRLLGIYPDEPRVQHLPQEIVARRNQQKQRLLDSWKEALARRDTDGSIEILKQLDNYLTPSEAESLQDSARGVFKDKLSHMRDQFTQVVHDHKWLEAVQLGDTIMSDFPNTRIAQEVREKMDVLRQRAGDGTLAPSA